MLTEIADRLTTIASFIFKNQQGKPYWIEISTKQPQCIYYFGPFENSAEAKQMQHGYIQDLVEEKASGISVTIKRCLPTNLTIMEEESLVG